MFSFSRQSGTLGGHRKPSSVVAAVEMLKKKKKLYVATEDIKADIKASEVRKSSPAHVVQKDLQMGHECHKPSPSCPPVHEKHDGKWN